LGTGVAGAIIASGTALGWEQGSALAIAFATCGAVALAASAGSVRLPSKLVSKR